MSTASSSLSRMTLVLGGACLVCSALLGAAYALAKPYIEAAEAARSARAVAAVLPSFQTLSGRGEVSFSGKAFPYYVALDGADTVGYAVQSTAAGFGGDLTLMVGITPGRIVHNVSVLSHSETPGLGSKCTTDARFMRQWVGFDPATKRLAVTRDGGDVDAITASTITSRAYALAVKNALEAFDSLREASSQNHSEQ